MLLHHYWAVKKKENCYTKKKNISCFTWLFLLSSQILKTKKMHSFANFCTTLYLFDLHLGDVVRCGGVQLA